jgi:hypothetical protein
MVNRTNGSLAAEAAAHLANSPETMGCVCGFQEDIRKQANALVKWARQQGCLLPDAPTSGLELYKEPSTEHSVYFRQPRGGRVIKCTKPGKFGYAHGPKEKRTRMCEATPLFYLQRVELMNAVFGSDLLLEGVVLDGGLNPYIVVSQSYIETADEKRPHPTESEIAEFMDILGFAIFPESCWNWFRQSDGIIVLDTKIGNFIPSPRGIIPIDLIIGQPDTI